MGTDPRGTTLLALARAAERRGLTTTGLSLTWEGLVRSKVPGPGSRVGAGSYLVALVRPGHYVLVERVWPQSVRVWDPTPVAHASACARTIVRGEWQRLWDGAVLLLEPSAVSSQQSATITSLTSLTPSTPNTLSVPPWLRGGPRGDGELRLRGQRAHRNRHGWSRRDDDRLRDGKRPRLQRDRSRHRDGRYNYQLPITNTTNYQLPIATRACA